MSEKQHQKKHVLGIYKKLPSALPLNLATLIFSHIPNQLLKIFNFKLFKIKYLKIIDMKSEKKKAFTYPLHFYGIQR